MGRICLCIFAGAARTFAVFEWADVTAGSHEEKEVNHHLHAPQSIGAADLAT
jgi:hypothetical protein